MTGRVEWLRAQLDDNEREASTAPPRVLAEVEAKRLLLDLHRGCDASCEILRVLALPYADRPGYEERAP